MHSSRKDCFQTAQSATDCDISMFPCRFDSTFDSDGDGHVTLSESIRVGESLFDLFAAAQRCGIAQLTSLRCCPF
eukprot:4347449-Prymnesium_polylepis.1